MTTRTRVTAQTRSCLGTRMHTHTRVFTRTDTHTRLSSPAQLRCLLSAPQGETLGDKADPRRPSPTLCAVPQFPLSAQPGTPTLPGPWAPVWHGASGAGWSPARPQGWHSRHFPEHALVIASRFGSQTPQLSPSLSQTTHHQAGSCHGEKHCPPSFLSLSRQYHSKIQLRLEQPHPEGQGRPQHLPCSTIWEAPAWPHCPEHPRAHPSIPAGRAASPPDPSCANTRAHPCLTTATESTAPHAVSPTSGCPRAGLRDSVSPLFKGRYIPPALGKRFWCGD